MDEILKCDIEMKATELYFPVVPFIVLYWQGVIILESLDEIFKCNLSNEIY